MATVSVEDIVAARQRISSGVFLSPCPESIPLSELCGMHIFCKLDYLQRTGSFKERGARNALLQLSEEQKSHGVISASAGNHALGIAYHGQLLNIHVTVVMPRFAPLVKVTTCRKFGARVILEGETYSEAHHLAREMAAHGGQTFIHGFNDPAIIAGQGTMGLEILEQMPRPDAIIVPIGGGGLIAGISLAVKTLSPEVRVIGVQAAAAPGFVSAIEAGHPVDAQVQPTLADGLAVSRVGELPFEIARPRVDRVVTVSEGAISLAVLRLMELEKSIVEGAAAVTLAACMTNQLPELAGKARGAAAVRWEHRFECARSDHRTRPG